MAKLYPETFKEICESVLEEADGRGVELASVALGKDTNGDLYLTNATHRNVVSWVADLYTRIQLLSPLWSFLHRRGKFLTVTADRDVYTKKGIREVNRESLYFIKSGETTRTPIIQRTYDWWAGQEQWDVSSETPRPTEIIQGPGVDEWILWPTPNAAGAVHGEWWLEPTQLEAADDQPCWDARHNPVLKWGVLRMYATELGKEGSAEKLLARSNQTFPTYWSALTRDHWPAPCGAPPLF